jgi:LytR cell envelope-related transcriptional attenuator
MSTIDQKNKLLYSIGLILALIITILTISVLVFKIALKDNTTNTPKIVVRPNTPTPTQTPINKATYKLIILNGSAVPKIAKKTSEQLQTLGYTNITIGNADKMNYPKTTVTFSDNLSTHEKSTILDDVRSLYPQAEISTDEKILDASAKIIIGKD